MAEYNFDALTPEDKANIKKELETARQLRGRFHATPTLPKFSGVDAGAMDFEKLEDFMKGRIRGWKL